MQTDYPIIGPLASPLGVSHKQCDVLNFGAPVHLKEGDSVNRSVDTDGPGFFFEIFLLFSTGV